MRKLYLFAAMAAMLAACSSDDLTVEKQVAQQNAEEAAVMFDAYTSRGTTRAGVNGPVDNTNIQTDLNEHNTAGFGVFGYYTNGESYTGSSRPDFFYNQQVNYDNSVTPKRWTYTPVKYWPNEFGSDAVSDQVDKLTLFAYLPWVAVTPLTGLVTSDENDINITGMTRNNATGDPLIKYTSSMISNKSVDLCYGVAAQDFTSSNSSANPNNKTAGQPYVDIVKPGTGTDSKIKFDFRHALAQLNVTIDAIVNDQTNGDPYTNIQTTKTRIWVRSVTFEGITQTGALNLNSPASSPNWYDVNGTSLITTGSLTVYDGRKDGREANELASSEAPATLNPVIVQSKPYKITAGNIEEPDVQGVTSTRKNLFAKLDGTTYKDADAETDPIFVIPTKEKMKVTIVYDVETVDNNLATVLSDGSTKGSTIENRIYKIIDGFGNIEAGKKYVLNLHLGMRTVDFDADIKPWDDYSTDVHLPANMAFFKGVTPATTSLGSVNLSHDMDTYQYAVTDLTPRASVSAPTVTDGADAAQTDVTITVNSNADGTGSANKVDGAGVTYVKAVFTGGENKTSTDITRKVKLDVDSKGGILTIVHKATPLKLENPTLSGSTLTLSYNKTDYVSPETLATDLTGATITIYNLDEDPSKDLFDTLSGVDVTLKSTEPTPTTGNKLKITVTKGDVTATLVWTVAP